jgi:hypothetical protein
MVVAGGQPLANPLGPAIGAVPPCIALKELRGDRRPRRQHLSGNGLTERDPDVVQDADNDLAHAVEHVVRTLHDLDSGLEAVVEAVIKVSVNHGSSLPSPVERPVTLVGTAALPLIVETRSITPLLYPTP